MPSTHLRVLRQIWTAPGNAPNRPVALLRAFRWFLTCHRATSSDQPALVHSAFGDRLFPCYTDSIIAKHVRYRSEWFDHDLLHFMDSYLQPSDHFLDVGANIGLHTLLASTRITSGTLTCVEPLPSNLQRLRHTLEINHLSRVTVLPVAASDSAGKVHLTGTDVFTRIADAPPSAPDTVDTVRLDQVLGTDAIVDFCKIDVEGAEWQVLRGLTGLIQRSALPVFAFELNGSLQAYGHREADFLVWIQDQGYQIATYQHDSRTLTFGTDSVGTANDLFALTPDGIARVKERMPTVVHRQA